jgi:hypothetical protein
MAAREYPDLVSRWGGRETRGIGVAGEEPWSLVVTCLLLRGIPGGPVLPGAATSPREYAGYAWSPTRPALVRLLRTPAEFISAGDGLPAQVAVLRDWIGSPALHIYMRHALDPREARKDPVRPGAGRPRICHNQRLDQKVRTVVRSGPRAVAGWRRTSPATPRCVLSRSG